jgi:hypothetical protein
MNVYEARKPFIDALTQRQTELNGRLSYLDQNQNDILHFIELEKYDAVAMVKLAKQLKETRRQRRIVKVELEQIEDLIRLTSKARLAKFINKKYTYRTDVISKVLH